MTNPDNTAEQVLPIGVWDNIKPPQRPAILRLVSVSTGYGAELDFYLLCSCGWCSLPYVEPPVKRVCEACKELAEGRRIFKQVFAPQSAKHGYQVEWTSR